MNQESLDLIKEFEGLRTRAYQDSVGVWTIGYGTTAAADVGIVPREGMTITEAEAEEFLLRFVNRIEERVRPHITQPISDNEMGAFVSLAYNIGIPGFLGSTALRKFNEGDKAGAADAILMWNKAGGRVLGGLERRRWAERAHFLSTPRPEQEEAPQRRSGWLSRLFRRKPTRLNTSKAIGRTPNDLPIYSKAEDYPIWRWPNFKPSEFDCKGTGRIALDPDAMDKLQALRTRIGKPFHIVSGYRSPEHNRNVGGAPRSKHMEGIAFDVSMSGHNREEFIREAEKMGFNGIGRYPSFVHIDTRPNRARW